MMLTGLTETAIKDMIESQLLASGRYTLTAPGGRPIFTKEQRDAIAHAIASALNANNEELIRQLRAAGVAGL